jgi:hypothetical protein
MQDIPRENLIPGKEYYLQCFESTHAPPNTPYKMIAKFEKLKQASDWEWACFTNFRKIKHRNNPDPNYGYSVELNLSWIFYEIASREVQKNMENRAYKMVLLDLIQDEHFKPIEVI